MTTTFTPNSESSPGAARDVNAEFAELVVANQSQLRNYICSLGVALGSVDDIAQEALLMAYKDFDKFERGTNFGAWVRTRALNLVRNDRAKTRRRYHLLNEKVTDLLVSIDPSTYLENQEADARRRSALAACVEKLPPRSRDLIEARYQKSLNAKEIATSLGQNSPAVRQRLTTIRRQLRDCITMRLHGETE